MGRESKIPNDIAKYVNEYCDVAYEGVKLNYPDFRCEFIIQLDQRWMPFPMVEKDFSRGILNIVNNVLFAVLARSKSSNGDYRAQKIIAMTEKGGNIELQVKDNGDGISVVLHGEIFEPFFKTKTPSVGFGLSQDIVRTHEGGILFTSFAGQCTKLTIRIPNGKTNYPMRIKDGMSG